MRASLPQTLRERRRSRAAEPHRRAGAERADSSPREPRPLATAPSPNSRTRAADLAVERVRDAGGPLDEASYTCHCGFVFRAPVSTTVSCPHCQTTQAW